MTSSTPGTRWNGLRRSEFKRKPLPIARTVEWQARTPIKAVSDRRKKENAVRTKVLAELKARYPVCQRCGVRPSVDGHELLRRSAGGSITDEGNIRMVCRPCHDWIGQHPAEAIAQGWQISRFGGSHAC